MKAIIWTFLIGFFVMAVLLLSGFILYGYGITIFQNKTAEFMSLFTVYKPYEFNMSELLVNATDPNVLSDANQTTYYGNSNPKFSFCSDLNHCIEMNIKKGTPCLITYKVKPNVAFEIDDLTGAVENCPQVNIKEDLYEGTQRKICKYKPIWTVHKLSENDMSLLEFEPGIHNCYLPDNLGPLNVLNDVNSINYLYSGRGTDTEYQFENGGTVRIVVTNVSIDKDFDASCSYSLYVCGQSAIAQTEDETTVNVFGKIRYLDESNLYYNETIVWNGEPKEQTVDMALKMLCKTLLLTDPLNLCGDFPDFPAGANVYGYNPRPYTFQLTSTVQDKKMALVDAVDAGMWEWNRINYNNEEATVYFSSVDGVDISDSYFSYTPISDVSDDSSLSYPFCWNISYESSDIRQRTELMEPYSGGYKLPDSTFTTSSIFDHHFKFDGPWSSINNISMTVGIKKIFITDHPMKATYTFGSIDSNILREVKNYYHLGDDFKTRVILVMDPLTFCSE
jgi:hypothetical protein